MQHTRAKPSERREAYWIQSQHPCLLSDGSQAAPVHLVIGHAGAGLSFTVQHEPPAIFEVVKVEHGYMRVRANGTSLACEVRNLVQIWC